MRRLLITSLACAGFTLSQSTQSFLSATEMLAYYPSCIRAYHGENILYPQATYCGVSRSQTPTQTEAECLCRGSVCDFEAFPDLCQTYGKEFGLQLARQCGTEQAFCDAYTGLTELVAGYCFDVIVAGLNLTEAEAAEMGDLLGVTEFSLDTPADCASFTVSGSASRSASVPSTRTTPAVLTILGDTSSSTPAATTPRTTPNIIDDPVTSSSSASDNGVAPTPIPRKGSGLLIATVVTLVVKLAI